MKPLSDDWLAPFRASPFSLRFELGGETFGNDAPVPRFLQAFGRARQVASEAFESSRRLSGLVAAPFGSATDFFAPVPDAFAALAAAGLAARPIGEWVAPLWPDAAEEEDRVPCDWRGYELSGDPAGWMCYSGAP